MEILHKYMVVSFILIVPLAAYIESVYSGYNDLPPYILYCSIEMICFISGLYYGRSVKFIRGE